MNKDHFIYFTWQCVLILICGIVGLIAVFIKPNLPRDIAVLFALIFAFCIITALFFLIWVKQKIKEEREERLINSIGEME